jgi:hypothetical protein
MKKLIALFLVFTALSCSSEDQVNQEVAAVDNTASVLDGKMLSFKNEELFVKEYSDLADLDTDELKNWVASKKLVSLLNTSDDSASMEEDVLSETRIIYSDALKSVLNSESKVKINGNVLWLNERTFYLLSEDQINLSVAELTNREAKLQKYGQLLSVAKVSKNITGRLVLPNENRIKSFASPEINVNGGRLRHVVDLYNETIVLNDGIQSSKMYLRSTLQYRSCSTLAGCRWKEAMNLRYLTSDFQGRPGDTTGIWTIYGIYNNPAISGTKTYQVGSWKFTVPYMSDVNFYISGPIVCSINGVVPTPQISMEMSWYY